MKKYFLSIFFVFTAMFAKAQTVCDTVYVLFTMVDTTNSSGTITTNTAIGAFGFVEYECLDTGDAPFYRRVKRQLDLNFDPWNAAYVILNYFIIR